MPCAASNPLTASSNAGLTGSCFTTHPLGCLQSLTSHLPRSCSSPGSRYHPLAKGAQAMNRDCAPALCPRLHALIQLVRPFQLNRVCPNFLGFPRADVTYLAIRIVVPALPGNGEIGDICAWKTKKVGA